jgi:hemophore-related protein
VNAFFTSLDGLNRSDSQSKAQDYLAANPQIKAEIDAMRGPATALRDRCNIPDDHIHFGVV